MRDYRRLVPFVLFLLLVACDNRATQQVTNPDSGPAAPPAEAGASTCPYPDGTCDFDADCPADHRCEGAMRTTGVPHTFVCRGKCLVKKQAPPGGTGSTGTGPGNVSPACDPNGGPLQVRIMPEGSDSSSGEADRAYTPMVAAVRNCSNESYYRLVGCCGEGQPVVERLADDGSWQPAGCPAMPEVCCDAEPSCNRFGPGDGYDWPLPFFDTCECGAGTFRLRFILSENADCSQDDLGVPPTAVSEPYVPHCY